MMILLCNCYFYSNDITLFIKGIPWFLVQWAAYWAEGILCAVDLVQQKKKDYNFSKFLPVYKSSAYS